MANQKYYADIDLNQNEIQNAVIQNLASAPATPTTGQVYFNTVDKLLYTYDGTNWVAGKTDSEGAGIDITSGVISIDNSVTSATKCKITYSAKGLVTAGADLTTSDIPDLSATYVATTLLGANSGVATLGADGKVPSSQLPAYVDDVIELLTMASSAPATCATGDKYYNTTSKKIFTATGTNTWGTTGADPVKDVIYVRLDNNGSYRWSGSDMVNIANPIGAATESTAGIAELATNSEVSTGTDDSRIVTPLKLATYYQSKLVSGTNIKTINSTSILGSGNITTVQTFTANNTALTASGGVCTWEVTNSTSSTALVVQVVEISTNKVIGCEIAITSSKITMKFNSSSNIAANTFRMVAIG